MLLREGQSSIYLEPFRIQNFSLQFAVEHVNISRPAKSFSPLPTFPHQTKHRDKREDSAANRKEQECKLVANPLGKPQGVKGKGHAKFLSEEVDELSNFASLGSVAINCVGVDGGRDDLNAERGNAHAEEGCDPDCAILQAEAVDEEASGHQNLSRPDSFQACFRFRVSAAEFPALSLDDVVHHPPSG